MKFGKHCILNKIEDTNIIANDKLLPFGRSIAMF